ncbi:PQQ-binding-like beta-propeller repeat protein, partial [bacterium]|nr:PQQ-binding-like beta-propeller repeat protein [bacterium]
MKRSTLTLALMLGLLTLPLHAASPDQTASKILSQSTAPGGVCSVDGANADLAIAIAKQGQFVVHVLCPDQAACDSVRKAIRARGMYGRVSAAVLTGERLPYTDNLVNIIIAGAPAPRFDVDRVLAPLGAVFSPDGERMYEKPWPKDIDEWGHYLHGADGNAVARDRVVGPPARYQWVSGPLWMRSHESDSSVSALVTTRGRMFAIVDEAPISLVGDHPLPDKWFLTAQDAFNGVPLWKVPIRRWGWREWKNSWFNTRPGEVPLNLQKRLVAAGDRLYVTLGYRAPVSQLDARTGAILKTYAGTERTNEILHLDGTLVLSVLEGDGARIVAVDAASGKRLWATERIYSGSTVDYIKWKAMHGASKPAKLDPAPNIATDGKVVAFIDGKAMACVDYKTGKEKWRTAFPSASTDLNAGGIRNKGNLWVGTTIVSHGVVIHASPSKLAGLDA